MAFRISFRLPLKGEKITKGVNKVAPPAYYVTQNSHWHTRHIISDALLRNCSSTGDY